MLGKLPFFLFWDVGLRARDVGSVGSDFPPSFSRLSEAEDPGCDPMAKKWIGSFLGA